MLTFDEAKKSLERTDEPSVLLGNGFSQAWGPKIFNYANLLAVANFGARDGVIRDLFARTGTHDFEKVMQTLISAQMVLEAYGADSKLITQTLEDQQLLKNALIAAISTTHPSLPAEVLPKQYESVRTFLFQFKQIFTLNYDLLMYWARNKSELPPEGRKKDDGFRAALTWAAPPNQNVHFLHGALHIYETGPDVRKHAYSETGQDSIVDQVKANLDSNRFPLFVAEPTAEQKLARIEHNPYLNFGYQKLEKLQGTLFIHGHSMNATDKHIFDQIRKSNVTRVFVSIFGDEESEAKRTDRQWQTRRVTWKQCVVPLPSITQPPPPSGDFGTEDITRRSSLA